MSRPSIPAIAEHVDADWLTQAVRAGGGNATARVTAVETRDLQGVNGGLMGDLSLLTLTWDRDDDALPRSAVLKLPTRIDENRAFATAFGQYAAEVGFYTHRAPHTDVRVPHCWYAAVDDAGADFVLLLEDLGRPHRRTLPHPSRTRHR